MLTDDQVLDFKEMVDGLEIAEIIQLMFKAGYDQAIEDLTGYETTGIGAY